MSEKDKWLEPDEYDENEDCAICFEPLGTTQAIFQLNCGHKFHNNCLLKWCDSKEGNITCPLCRAPADEGVCNSVYAFKEHVLDESSISNLPHTLSIYKKGSSGGKLNKKRRRKTTTKKRKNNKKTRTRKNRRQTRK